MYQPSSRGLWVSDRDTSHYFSPQTRNCFFEKRRQFFERREYQSQREIHKTRKFGYKKRRTCQWTNKSSGKTKASDVKLKFFKNN